MTAWWRKETGIFLALWTGLMLLGPGGMFRDPGTFWHVTVGERLLDAGRMLTADPFSCTRQGEPWLAYSWLADIALALLHRLAGLDAVLLGTAAYLAGLYTWLAARLLRAGLHVLPALLLVAMTLMATSYHLHPRPHLVNFAFLGGTLALLAGVEAGRLPLTRLWLLAPCYVVWTNLHGGMLGGVATAGLVATGWTLAYLLGWESPIRNVRHLLVLLALVGTCAVAGLVNPYGLALPRLWLTLLDSPLLPRIMDEHAPLLAHGWTGPAPAVLAFAAVYLAALLGTWPGRPRVTWLIPLAWLALAFTRVRHGPLFAVTAAVALADLWPHVRWVEALTRRGSTLLQRHKDVTPWTPRAAGVPAAVVATTLLLQTLGVTLPVVGRGWVRLDPGHWPVELLDDLRRYEYRRPGGTPILNEMIYGGFLIYHTPGYRVFLDDRCELYGDAFLAECAFDPGGHLEEWERRYDFPVALVQAGSAYDRALQGRWQAVRRTRTAVLYEAPRARNVSE